MKFFEVGVQIITISYIPGNHLLKGLEELRRDFDIVGDVRGKGLMIGVEMVTDKETRYKFCQEPPF